MHIDVYDGYVACTQESHDMICLHGLSDDVGYKNAIGLVTVTLRIKAPLFVRFGLVQHALKVVDIPKGIGKTFIPDITMIKSGDHEMDRDIVAHITHMMEATMINIKGFQQDGCDRFMAQLVTPISTYVEFYATMTLEQMIKYSLQKLPVPMQKYVEAFDSIITATWPNLRQLKEKIGDGKADLEKRTRKVTRPSGRGNDNVCMSCEGCSDPDGSCEEVQDPCCRSETKTTPDK